MDGLISRKALLKQFIISDSERRIPEYDIDNFPVTIAVKDVKDIIRKEPVAFDKEKVIEELQFLKQDAIRHKKTDYADAYELAIEVIKKGGVE